MATSTYDTRNAIGKPGPWEKKIPERNESDDSSAGGTSTEEEDEERAREIIRLGDIPSEYWHIQKLIKYMKTGNQTATMVALCCLKDHDLTAEINQIAVQDVGGLEVLVNLIETKDLNCKLGALSVLAAISVNVTIRRRITDLGGVNVLIRNICDPARDLQILAAETLANVTLIRRARRIMNTCGGIPKVVDLIDVPEKCLNTPWKSLSVDDMEMVNIAKAGTRALWSLSRSRKNRVVMRKSGVVFLLAKLLRSVHLDVIIPTIGTIQECAEDPSYQLAIRTEGMVKDIVKHLSTVDSQELRSYSAAAIFKCAEDAETRNLVRDAGGLDPLVSMAKAPDLREDKQLLAAVTGAIWKCAANRENMVRFNQLGIVQAMVDLLEDENEEVLTNAVGALSECVKLEDNRAKLRTSNGIPLLVNLLNSNWPPLLENVPKVLCQSAQEENSMHIIEELDGVRLIWSLLKHKSPRVQSAAAWALVPCVTNASDSGEMVRSFVGGLELIVKLLNSEDIEVLAAVCAALAVVSNDRENLAVITDHGLIPMLVKHIHTKDELLQEHLAKAIAYSCSWGTNCKDLGRLGAITPLVGYMAESGSASVQRSAALALFHLSKNPFNCITMHESGVVTFLLRAVASSDENLQEAAAGCLSNIRRFALEAETYHLVDKGFKKERDTDSESD